MQSDVFLTISFPTGEKVKAGVNVRPFCYEILEELHNLFEIVVFTASHSSYANTVIDYIDPENKYIKHRFFREHCA